MGTALSCIPGPHVRQILCFCMSLNSQAVFFGLDLPANYKPHSDLEDDNILPRILAKLFLACPALNLALLAYSINNFIKEAN